MKMHDRWRNIAHVIHKYDTCDARSPTYRELGTGAGIPSTSHVSYCLRKMRTRGWITYHDNMSRTVRLTENGRKHFFFKD